MAAQVVTRALAEIEKGQTLLASIAEGLRRITAEAHTDGRKKINPTGYVSLAVEAIKMSGNTEMRLDELLEYIRGKRGAFIKRDTVEATLASHIKSKTPRLIRTGKTLYGIPSAPEV